mgnify:CR=1 FL=1
MIRLENVSKSYNNGVHALRDINLTIEDGEFVYIIGPTGSGKSTLIKLLDGEEIPDQGRVRVNDVDVGKLRHSKVPFYRRSIGVVFQDFRLLPHLTIFENISFALEVIGMDRQQIRQRVREVLELVSLSEKAKAFPNQLSGGQQQRATIGRAIANHPKVLIADEPTGNLDTEMSKEVIELLEKINEKEKTTVLMVTHDKNLVDAFKKRTISLEEGYIVADMMKGGYLTYD